MTAPFMQLYIADYMADTRHLTCEQDGAYMRLLMAMWRSGGSLPLDHAKLARITGLSASRWVKVRDDVMAFFVVADGYITQGRLTRELKKAEEKSAKRSEAGKAGAEAKALKNNETPKAIAEPLPKHSLELEPEQETEEKRITDVIPKDGPSPVLPKSSPVKGTRFPAEQNLPPTWADYASGKGFTQAETETEFEKFRNYWIAKSGKDATKTDWAATWRNWIITATERRGPRNPVGGADARGGNKPSRGWSANLSQHRPDPTASPFAGPTVIEGEYAPKRSGGGIR